jgi:hypothetical protein
MKNVFLSLCIVALALGSSLSSQANSSVPTVTCSLAYSKLGTGGVTTDFKQGDSIAATETGTENDNNGFKLVATLQKVCAPDGGQCRAYKLNAAISQGSSSTSLDYNIRSGQSDRVSTTL